MQHKNRWWELVALIFFIHPIFSLPPSSAVLFHCSMHKILNVSDFLYLFSYTAGIIIQTVAWQSSFFPGRRWSLLLSHFAGRTASDMLWCTNPSSIHDKAAQKSHSLSHLLVVKWCFTSIAVPFHVAADRAVKSDDIVMPPSDHAQSLTHLIGCNSLPPGHLAAAVPHSQIPFGTPSLSPQPEIHWFFLFSFLQLCLTHFRLLNMKHFDFCLHVHQVFFSFSSSWCKNSRQYNIYRI